VDEAKTLSILVKPGWKKGTKISFVNEGDEGPGLIASDIEFIVQEKENSDPGYVRDGNNLIYTHKLSLSDALTDHNGLQVRTLDSRIISIACPEVVSPFYEKIILGSSSSIALCESYFMWLSQCVLVCVLSGEGMPISKKPGTKGDLIVRFHILFPKYLNGEKRNKIKELLAGEELQT